MLPRLILAGLVLLVGLPAFAQAFADNFNDNAINPALWSIFTTGTGTAAGERNSRVEMTVAANAAGDPSYIKPNLFGVGFGSGCELRGDFDLQVDFDLLTWPSQNGVRVVLAVDPNPQTAGDDALTVERTSFGNPSTDFPGFPREVYLTHSPAGAQGITATTDLSGRLRLTRVGAMLTGYYRSGTDWVPLHTDLSAPTGDVHFSVSVHSADQVFTDQAVMIAFDNFVAAEAQPLCSLTCGDGVLDPIETCDDGFGRGDPSIPDLADEFDSCPNGHLTLAAGVGCRIEQTCGDALQLEVDSSDSCSGLCSNAIEECDNGNGQAIIDGVSQPSVRTCFGDRLQVCQADADCGVTGPCGNSDIVIPACTTSCSMSSPQEICDNGADDDGDGWVDLRDPDCCGVRASSTFWKTDPDGDGLPNRWEVCGVDVDRDGVTDVSLDGADPDVPDVFVEVDWLEASDHSHRLSATARSIIESAFSMAPFPIRVHLDVGQMGGGNAIPELALVLGSNRLSKYDWDAFDALKFGHFSADRQGVFRYALLSHNVPGGILGRAKCIPGSDFLTALGSCDGTTKTCNETNPVHMSANFLHELGHTLGLQHGGGDAENFKPNYLSVMNYSFSAGLETSSGPHVDFSRGILPTLREGKLTEILPLVGAESGLFSGYSTVWYCGDHRELPTPIDSVIDWNCDRVIEGRIPATSVNNNIWKRETLVSHDDWANLQIAKGLSRSSSCSVVETLLSQHP